MFAKQVIRSPSFALDNGRHPVFDKETVRGHNIHSSIPKCKL